MANKRREPIPVQILNSFNGKFQFFIRIKGKEFIIQKEVFELLEELNEQTKTLNNKV